jgi:hypothetical protein
LRDLLTRLLERDPKKRIRMDDLRVKDPMICREASS